MRKALQDPVTLTSFAVAAGFFLGGLATEPLSAETQAASSNTAITGRVTLEGKAPKNKTISLSADPFCARAHEAEVHLRDYVVDDKGGLANVFVYVKEGAPDQPPPEEVVVLDQKGCLYFPKVLGIQVGQRVEIRNSDETLHNVNCQPGKNRGFNRGMPMQGQKFIHKFTKPEVMLHFRCNVHPWMVAHAGVLPHPYFSVSAEDGSFEIPPLPPGDYLIEAWHDKLGSQTMKVHLEEGASKALELSFKASN